jgi:L-threonylcarbamoyladenylate synthase
VMPLDAQRYAHDLYARLHDLDQLGCRVIVVERPPQSIEWEAVQDRLKRAAADRPNPDHAQ